MSTIELSRSGHSRLVAVVERGSVTLEQQTWCADRVWRAHTAIRLTDVEFAKLKERT